MTMDFDFSLPETFAERMQRANVDRARFSRISSELLGRGTIYREASETQRALYDDAIRIEEMLEAFWSIPGFRIVVDRQFGYIQMFPPGARIPGMTSEPEFEAAKAVRRPIRPDMAGVILVLRQMYDEHVMRGDIADNNEVPVRIEEIDERMIVLLKRKLPDSAVERERLLANLRFRILIRYGEGAHMPGSDARIAILPPIVSLMSREFCHSIINALREGVASCKSAQPTDELED
jgi:hypothetical protein